MKNTFKLLQTTTATGKVDIFSVNPTAAFWQYVIYMAVSSCIKELNHRFLSIKYDYSNEDKKFNSSLFIIFF
jgi:hypothetical protein